MPSLLYIIFAYIDYHFFQEAQFHHCTKPNLICNFIHKTKTRYQLLSHLNWNLILDMAVSFSPCTGLGDENFARYLVCSWFENKIVEEGIHPGNDQPVLINLVWLFFFFGQLRDFCYFAWNFGCFVIIYMVLVLSLFCFIVVCMYTIYILLCPKPW